MEIIVVGFGRVGARTARVLSEEGHDVVVVDNVPEKADSARQRGLTVVDGDGTDEDVLETAGIGSADAVGALTGDADVNHSICLIGRAYGCRTVLRISEDVSDPVYREYNADADEIVYPERLGAAGAKTALLGGSFNAIGAIAEELQILVLTVAEGSPIVGKHVNEIDLGDRGRIYAHGRDRDPLTIPLPGTVVSVDDRIALLAATDAVEGVRDELVGD